MAKGNKKAVIFIILAAVVAAGVAAYFIVKKRRSMTKKQVAPPISTTTAASATVTAGYSPEYFPLKKGMYGENVRALQAGLMLVGYDVGRWGTDGKFGADTLTAVRAYFKNSNKNEVTEAEWKPLYTIYKIENNLPTTTII